MKDAKFTKVWEKHVSQPVAYEGGKLYFENYRTCMCVHGLNGVPQKIYKLPSCPTSQKIEDCLIAQYPLNDIPSENRGYRNCLLALTANNHLLRYDVDTGQLLEDVYMSCRYKFRHLSWDSEGYTLVANSTHEKMSQLARQANITCGLLMVLSVFTIYPLQCIAMMEINKNIFGGDVTDAMISQGVLILMHQSNLLRFYSFSHILQQGKQFNVDLGAENPAGPNEGLIGSYPNGIPVNIKLEECPPVLFEVRCAGNKLTIGGRPWHYIITPPKYQGIFHVYTLQNQKMVKNGTLDMGTLSVEPDKCFFHADDSGRILHIGANQVRVLQLTEINPVSELEPSMYELCEEFSISANQQPLANSICQGDIDNVRYTSSGRVIKKSRYKEDEGVYETESIQTVDYEDDLDLLVITTVHQNDDHYRGNVCLYDNDTGHMIKTVQLKEPWKEFCDHVVAVDLDTIVHIVKGPMRKFNIYVYRLDRSPSSSSNESENDKTKSRRSCLRRSSRRSGSRSSVTIQEVEEEDDGMDLEQEVEYSSIRSSSRPSSSRRTAQRSQSSFR